MKQTISTILALAVALGAWAFNIGGSVVDEAGIPLPKAGVRLLAPADSSALKSAITNDDGTFQLTGVKRGSYLLEASYVGYTPVYRRLDLKANVDLGPLAMAENVEMLKEVSVTGVKTPIRVAEDTVEFNADSYKTQPNAVVEDLLKRLPGVEVDSEGKITHNGKEIKKILVDGKEFFADDPKVASKNLPVNMVEKLQVVDRKSDLARLTGVDDGEDETVINLTVKKGMNNGWFGNVEAGYGTDSRYKASFNVNRFWNGNQITILGGANNVNDLNFTDGGAGRFRRFGGANGITTSSALGLNFNVGREEIIRVGGDVMYSHSNRDTRTRQDRQYLFPDSSSFSNSTRNTIDRGHNIRADFRMEWKPDSLNTLDVRPNMSVNISDSESDEFSRINAGIRGSNQIGAPVNDNSSRQLSHGTSYEFGGRIIYNHRFKSRIGRSFSMFANFSSSNVRERQNSLSRINYYLLSDSTSYDQYADDHTWSNNVSARVSWTEPIGDPKKGNSLTFAYRFQYRWNDADKLTYLRPVNLSPEEQFLLESLPSDVLSDSLSNRFRNNYMNQDIRIGFKHVTKTQNLDVGVSLVPQMSRSVNLIDDNKTIPERWVWNFAPYLRYRLKMSDTRSLNVRYNGRSSQPSMNQLQPVADESNPLNIVVGNPNLDPSFSHNVNARFQDFNQKESRAIMAMLNASMTQNAIISRTEFNSATGGQRTTYENVNGVWNLNAFTMVSLPLRDKHFSFNNHFGGNFNRNVGYNNGLRNNSHSLGIFESFGFAWRPDNLEFELRPNYRLQYTTNSVPNVANRTVHSFGGRFNASYYAPFGLVLSTDLNYTANRGYGQGYNTNEWMWNASVAYQFLRDRSLMVTLSAYDLLQMRSNVQRSTTAAYIQDALYNSLTRYFMCTISWKFNTFGKGKQPDDSSAPRFGPPGRPGGFGGRPPMR